METLPPLGSKMSSSVGSVSNLGAFTTGDDDDGTIARQGSRALFRNDDAMAERTI